MFAAWRACARYTIIAPSWRRRSHTQTIAGRLVCLAEKWEKRTAMTKQRLITLVPFYNVNIDICTARKMNEALSAISTVAAAAVTWR